MTKKADDLYSRIYSVVKEIPTGRVATYGRIARMVDGATPRIVGYAMAATPDGEGIPWHRVINAKGEISPRANGAPDPRQRERLIAEGVAFNARGKIDLERYGWERDPFGESV